MRLIALFSILCLQIQAQNLPIQSVTLFKNGRSMVQRSGKVGAPNGVFATNDLPEALFGTFWLSAPKLKSVFTQLDSIRTPGGPWNDKEYFRSLQGKPVWITLQTNEVAQPERMEGVFEFMPEAKDGSSRLLLFRTAQGKWITLTPGQLLRVEFSQKPDFTFSDKIELKKRMEVQFQHSSTEQELNMTYLTGRLGWTPIYRLEIQGKDKGKLSLRAEIVNDAEDLGNNPELRLAVGIPNFMFAHNASNLLDFSDLPIRYMHDGGQNSGANQRAFQTQFSNVIQSNAYETINDDALETATDGPEGNQVEDYYYYTLRPSRFPKGSRYQLPIFETEVETAHYYECLLPEGGPATLQSYRSGNGQNDKNAVNHFISFNNKTTYPWTTGPVNLFGGVQLQPISQDLLPYTAAGGKCKVRIAEAPEIKVTQTEGDTKREENVQLFFNRRYDRVSIEGQICVVNYKKEPVTLKIKRKIEGTPIKSNEQNWTLTQEAATLRVNTEYVVEWELTLKPGEEKKWKYQYDVLVDL